MRSRTANIDPATIPDDVLKSERARRNAVQVVYILVAGVSVVPDDVDA